MARTSNDSDRWDRRERFFFRTLGPEVTGKCCVGFQEHQMAFSHPVVWSWGWESPFFLSTLFVGGGSGGV